MNFGRRYKRELIEDEGQDGNGNSVSESNHTLPLNQTTIHLLQNYSPGLFSVSYDNEQPSFSPSLSSMSSFQNFPPGDDFESYKLMFFVLTYLLMNEANNGSINRTSLVYEFLMLVMLGLNSQEPITFTQLCAKYLEIATN